MAQYLSDEQVSFLMFFLSYPLISIYEALDRLEMLEGLDALDRLETLDKSENKSRRNN